LTTEANATAAAITHEPPALRRVMLVDDSEIDAELLRLRLQGQYPGLQEVRWVREGLAVLEEVQDFEPDLVITDFHMPGYDLIATLRALRRRWPLLPVLVMSGLVGEEAAIQVLKAGASDFLPKSRAERLSMVIDRELAEAGAKRVEMQLRAALERQHAVYQAIIDEVQAGLWIVSPQGVIERTNHHGAQMMGGAPALVLEEFAAVEGWWVDTGQPIGPHDWPGARAIRHGERVVPRLMRVRNFAGEWRHFSCGASPLQAADGHSLGAVISAVDLSSEVELQDRLRHAEALLRQLSRNQNAQHERQMARVARDLHDNLGQLLSLVKLHLGSAARTDLPLQRRALEIEEALPLVDQALIQLRDVCNDLLPSELSDFGLFPALASLCSAAGRASGLAVQASESGSPRAIEPALQLGLFRVAQAALTNALRHAAADVVQISLEWQPGDLALKIIDNGVGFDLQVPRAPMQQGLRGMRERMELLGGALTVDTSAGCGTTVCARLAIGHPS
jgi:two-component system, NarL family, sensor histidine kinase UhpB